MGSDRARVSYAVKQYYRSVVMQQGRVTLEADWNESQTIFNEELLNEALEIVGRVGTPDNGYRVTQTSAASGLPFDFNVTPGSLYLGGLRLVLDQFIQYSNQLDWLDHSGDHDWIDPSLTPSGPEYIYLLVREQEVSAVEDSALREVALGGPDTAQRSRMIQRIVRLSSDAIDCKRGLLKAEKTWTEKGLQFIPETMRLLSQATLLASFPVKPKPDPCDPGAVNGYLGADNQMIRIQITSANTLVWGFDDASFLYRIKINISDPQTITLQSQPVDAYHQPQSGQAVEVLRSAAQLDNKEYIASANGIVMTLATAYNPDTQQIDLPAALPAEYIDSKQTPRLFLRVWQQQLTFTPGAAIELGNTGLFVTLDTSNGAPFHIGDWWMLAVRPSTTTALYPQRYLDKPQPPEGPRYWACPMAAIEWNEGELKVDEVCIPSFLNLVELSKLKRTGCCTVSLLPEDLSGTSLQTIIDAVVIGNKSAVKICLGPGTYKLSATLNLDSRHSNLSIEACPGGAILQAQDNPTTGFQQGLISLMGVNNVSLHGLTLMLPLTSYNAGTLEARSLTSISIGLRPVDCGQLSVEACTFNFETASANNSTLVAAGILAGGDCEGLRLIGNRFEGWLNPDGIPSGFQTGFSMFSGSFHTTTLVSFLGSMLNEAVFRNNEFKNLNLAVLAYADCGLINLEANTVRNCSSGFVFLSLPTLAYVDSFTQVSVAPSHLQSAAVLHNGLYSILANPVLQTANAVFRGFPLASGYTAPKAVKLSRSPAATLKADFTGIQHLYDLTLHTLPTTSAAVFSTMNIAETRLEAHSSKVKSIKLINQPQVLTEHPLAGIQPMEVNLTSQNLTYNLIEKQAFALKRPNRSIPSLSLRIIGNDVQVLTSGGFSGIGLLIVSLGIDDRDTINLSANSIIGKSSFPQLPTAMIFGGSRCTVTGNTILNESPGNDSQHFSFLLAPRTVTSSIRSMTSPVAAVAVTGNVFRGQPFLPLRTLSPAAPPPMDEWYFFNSIS